MTRVIVVLLAVTLPACTTVKPWQRARLASPAMNPRFGDVEITDQYRAKLIESRTGGGLPGSSPGGGCGCSQ